jgi:hypothetical protein
MTLHINKPRAEAPSRIGLISCSKGKGYKVTKAQNLYKSARFQLAVRWAGKWCDAWFIISAKHGLVPPNQVLAPYDVSLAKLSHRARVNWGEKVVGRLKTVASLGCVFVFIGDDLYFKYIKEALKGTKIEIRVPLKGLSRGARVVRLRALIVNG